jgi:hypothetical protein
MDMLLHERPTSSIPKAALRALTELTGQVELGPAVLITLKDAVEYRLEAIATQIDTYERRYDMTFKQFDAQGRSGDLPNSTSYQTEQDYFEWDGLITRQQKLSDILQWLA